MIEETKPNHDDISERLQTLRDTASALHAQWKRVDDYLAGDFPIWDTARWPIAASWEQYHPSLAWSIYSRARDRMTTAIPRVKRRLLQNTAKGRKVVADQKIEPWANEGLKYMLRIDPAPKTAWANGMAYGQMIVKGPVLDPEWEELDPKAKTFWPARFTAPHPATVLLDPLGPTMPKEVFEFRVISASALRAMIAGRRVRRSGETIGDWENDDKKTPFVTIGERWTRGWHSVFTYGQMDPNTQTVNVQAEQGSIGRLLYTEPNNWGFVPFSQSPTFWGKVKATATLKQAWAQSCTGVIDPLFNDLTVDAIGQSAILQMLLDSAMMGWQTQSDPGQIEQEVHRSRFVRTNVPDDLKPFPSKDIKPATFDFFSNVRQRIEEASHTRQLGGFPVQNTDTLGQTLVNIGEASKAFAFPKERLEVVMSAPMSNLLRFQERIIDEYDMPMRIMGLELTKGDIEHDYNLEVEFRVVEAALEAQKEESVIRKLDKLLIDPETAREELGYENIAELEHRQLKDMVLKSPEAMFSALAAVSQELGLADAAAAFSREQAAARAQREATSLGQVAPTNGNGTGEMPLASDMPTNPMRDLGPAGALRRNKTGQERAGA